MSRYKYSLINILSILFFLMDGNRPRTHEADTIVIDSAGNRSPDTSEETNWKPPAMDNLHINIAKPIDVGKSLRKFINPNSMTVMRALYNEGPLNFSQLMDKTGLSKNVLNHTLHELKDDDLIISREKRYYITNYSVTLLEGLDNILKVVGAKKEDQLFAPAPRLKKDGNAY